MKALILSDIHVDTHFAYAVKPSYLKADDPKEIVTMKTMDYLWKFRGVPETEAIIIPGDMSNDYLTFTRQVKWLSEHYKEVYLVPGNHDLIVRGGTPSKSNLQFDKTEDKLKAMEETCEKYTNVHFLNGKCVNGVAGCMGMNDFKCEPPMFGPGPFNRWKKWFDGKHWKYFNSDPFKIWDHYDKLMTDLCAQKPKIMVTHFVPYEAGVNWKYRNDPLNEMFYFQGEKYLNMLDAGTIWAAGHVHDPKQVFFYNDSGNEIKIYINPLGYPGEWSQYTETIVYPEKEGQLQRGSDTYKMENFIVEI